MLAEDEVLSIVLNGEQDAGLRARLLALADELPVIREVPSHLVLRVLKLELKKIRRSGQSASTSTSMVPVHKSAAAAAAEAAAFPCINVLHVDYQMCRLQPSGWHGTVAEPGEVAELFEKAHKDLLALVTEHLVNSQREMLAEVAEKMEPRKGAGVAGGHGTVAEMGQVAERTEKAHREEMLAEVAEGMERAHREVLAEVAERMEKAQEKTRCGGRDYGGSHRS